MKNRIAVLALFTATAAVAYPSSFAAEQTPSSQQAAASSAEAAQSVWDGIYTEEQANRGAALYAQRCARCHAPDLTGGEIAPALISGEFKTNWSGLWVDDLFERIKVSMPADNPGSLSRQQTADVLAFVLSKGGFPAGKTELRREAEVLKGIRFEESKPENAGGGEAPRDWDQFVADYLEAYFAAHPDVAVYEGRHEFDGKLPDFSRAGIDKEIARLHSARERASAFAENLLDARQKFEREYVLAAIDSDLFWLESARWPYRNPFFYNWSLDPQVYLTRPYAPLDQRMRAFTAYENALPRTIHEIQSNLQLPMPKTYTDFGRLMFGGLARYFEHDVPGIFADVNDAKLQSEFATANRNAIGELKKMDEWFASQRAAANDNFAIGAELFQKMLYATERVDVPLDRLEAIGRQDLERNLAALKEACAQFAKNATLAECTAKEIADKPNGKPVEAAREQLKELKAFVAKSNVVSIPGTEEAQVNEAPPYQRWNIAFITIPGPYEKGLPSVFYVSPPDPAWTPAKQREYLPGKARLVFISAHEVWPGHFLQFLHANRVQSRFGQVFVGYAYAEGWAHYAEELMWDVGFGNNDPEIHIGQLTDALMRDVRFLSAIGLHTGHMSVAESEKMFRESAFSDAGNAQQQAARGTFDPAYLNYTMGKLMIRKLRDDWTATRGGRNGWREFHDQFLSFGGPPIPLVRQAMLGNSAGPPL